MRLLFAGTTFTVGGAERILAHLVRGLSRDPFRVEVAALRTPGTIGEELRDSGIPVHAGLTGSGRIDPFLLPRLRALVSRFDAIYFLDHAHAVFYGVLASLGTSARVRVMPVHTTGQWDGRPSLGRPIRMVRPKLDRIIAIAEAQRQYLIEQEGVPERQLVVIPNGVPLESPSLDERRARRARVRAELGVPEDRPVAGITAVLRPEKNHELLLGAFARVRARLPEAELWIVGDGPRRAFIEAEAERLGLPAVTVPEEPGAGPVSAAAGSAAPGTGASGTGSSGTGSSAAGSFSGAAHPAVRFFGRRSDARRIMAGFDVAVLASHPRVETLPLSLIEAMDAGLPVIGTRVGALHEMIEEGRSGALVAPGGEDALADALGRVLCDPRMARAWGDRGQEIARERYSVEGMVEATARLLVGLHSAK